MGRHPPFLSALESVNRKVASTIEAAALCKTAERGPNGPTPGRLEMTPVKSKLTVIGNKMDEADRLEPAQALETTLRT
jgi:hypothetical protein